MSDPLDERDEADAQVRGKRIVEQLDDANQIEQLSTLLQNEALRDFLWRVIGWCGPFNDSWNQNYGRMSYDEGRQSVGRYLMREIAIANPEAMLEMQLKANRAASAAAKAEALKSLRKGRLT